MKISVTVKKKKSKAKKGKKVAPVVAPKAATPKPVKKTAQDELGHWQTKQREANLKVGQLQFAQAIKNAKSPMED